MSGDGFWFTTALDGSFAAVEHGSDAGVARPDVDVVLWVGTVEPTNMVVGDLWIDTDEDPPPVTAADVTFDPTGLDHVTATDVQTAVEELDAAITAVVPAGRWEVLLDGSEQPVSTGAGDWLYVWIEGI